MSIEIVTGFDGSCPCCNRGVRRNGEREFVLFPSYRRKKGISEEAYGKGSRFSTRVRNTGRKPESILLRADWGSPVRTGGHDLGYVRHEKASEWTMIPGDRSGQIVEYRIEALPGITHLGLYPEYNYADCAGFVRTLKRRGVSVSTAGTSREKRDIWHIVFPSPNPNARNFFIQARDHAYETAGSYCVEGICAFLLSEEPLARYLRSKFTVHIAPMTNPDGVYNGMSRLTWEQGADMNRVHTVPDPAHDVHRNMLDAVRPSVHMNIHNWTLKFEDGLLCNEESMAVRIRSFLPDDWSRHKRWRVETLKDYLKRNRFRATPPENWSWKNYCRENFDAIAVCFEFPWFGINTAQMRSKGRDAFVALALSAIEEKQW